jgi:hypothetical protein
MISKLLLILSAMALPVSAASTTLVSFGFDDAGDPWNNTGEVSFTNFVGTPAVTGSGGADHDGPYATIDGETYAFGTDFAGGLVSNFGIQLWIRNPVIHGEGDVLIASIGDPASSGVSLWLDDEGYFSVFSNGVGGGGVFYAPNELSEWTHISVVYTTRMYVFINGVEEGNAGAPMNEPTSDWYLFTDGSSGTVLGADIDQLELFSFNEGEFVAEEDLKFFAMPEPSAASVLLGLGALVYSLARRERSGLRSNS